MNPKLFKKCCVRGCRTSVNRKHRKSKCAKHHIRAWADQHPLARALHNLRTHARERGISFSLTREQFRSFAEKTDYLSKRGRSSISLQVDRIENGLGYHAWNIQALTLRENARKNYVPYFNGGIMPKSVERTEYLEFERASRDEMENIASHVSKKHTPGSEPFWQEFNKIKANLFLKIST